MPLRSSSLARHGYTLTELIVVVLILSVLAGIAVPRLHYAAVHRVAARGIAQGLVTDLRRARAEAIAQAARNPSGFALIMTGPPAGYRGYRIVDLRDSRVLVEHDMPANVCCTGGRRFEFGPLGSLNPGSDAELRVTAPGQAFTICIISATGAVKWAENN